MFKLSNSPLDTKALATALEDAHAGALVTFEGKVRNHNHGRAVTKLEYEGAEDMASAEFAKIVTDAREQFEIVGAAGAHRVGILHPGETAVWIGVTSVHRSAAFAACKFLIDELKKRLPVWKKEHYTDGSSDWINNP